MLYDANAATAALKSFPSFTYTSLTSFSDFCNVLQRVSVSSKALIDTSKRVTADSIAGLACGLLDRSLFEPWAELLDDMDWLSFREGCEGCLPVPFILAVQFGVSRSFRSLRASSAFEGRRLTSYG